MGGCATKPKVLKGEDGEFPSPKEVVPDGKEAAAGQAENKVEADKASENKDVADDNIDDQSNKKQSLCNLLTEKENKGTDESNKKQSEAEPMKKETVSDTVKQELEAVSKNQEPEKPVEPVSGNIEPNEAKPAPAAETKDKTVVANSS